MSNTYDAVSVAMKADIDVTRAMALMLRHTMFFFFSLRHLR